MPLDIKLKPSVIDSCERLVIEDITGDYSDVNTGGWGGFNAPANSGSVVVVTSILLELQINAEGETRVVEIVADISTIMPRDKATETQTFGEDDTDATFSNPIAGSLKDFRLSISQQSMLEKIGIELMVSPSSYGLSYDEANYAYLEGGIYFNSPNPDSSKILDSIYTITPTYVSNDGDVYPGVPMKFNNTCLTEQHISELSTSVDFRCEDCDDSDLEQIHLAHSLLDTLKNI